MAELRSRRRDLTAGSNGIDLRRLRYFLAVCDYGGFSKASEAIGIAQPTLTQQMKLLEEEIGHRLLDRHGRGAQPSEAGRFLVSRSRQHLDGLDGALRDLRSTFAAENHPVRIGVCPSIAPLLLDDLVRHIDAQHPNLSLSVIQAYSGDLKSLMHSGRIDVALTYRGSIGEEYSNLNLLTERLALVSGARVKLPKGVVSLVALAKLKLILPTRIHELRRIIDRACATEGVTIEPELELDSLGAVKSILLDGAADHHTILPYHCVVAEASSGALGLAEIDHPGMRRTIVLVAPQTPCNAEAIECIAARVRMLADELKSKLPTLL